eukprot:Blabericola_migrator_1__6580@NODE_3318_length_1865_cov_32_517798_g2074_i0_p1_GENE_NODE_3318_length_1865_cov_32_517798_g2074_i0NODE_3318_length_1865_cov_32_517798_g2074_i0_p1_ORF_typecomplete_len103_score16_63_NODE_3318_length_1865_cov_32_517798_g2074_i010171325
MGAAMNREAQTQTDQIRQMLAEASAATDTSGDQLQFFKRSLQRASNDGRHPESTECTLNESSSSGNDIRIGKLLRDPHEWTECYFRKRRRITNGSSNESPVT